MEKVCAGGGRRVLAGAAEGDGWKAEGKGRSAESERIQIRVMRLSKEHLAWVLEVIADLDWVPRSRVDDIKKSVSRLIGTKTGQNGRTEESDGLPAVEEAVIICECDNHDRANDNLSVHDNRALLNRVHTWAERR